MKAASCIVFSTALLVGAAGCRSGVEGRVRAVYALGRNPTPAAIDRIAGMAEDPDRDVRATVLVVLGDVAPPRAKALARDAIGDRDGLVRAAAVRILGDDPDPATLDALAERAAGDPVWQVRAAALEASAPHDAPVVRASFARALLDPVRNVRRAALTAGGATPGLLPVDRLAQLLVADPDWQNRVEAARRLGESGSPEAYAALDGAAADRNEFVRAAVGRALKELASAGIARPAPVEGPAPSPASVPPLPSQEDDAVPPSPPPAPTAPPEPSAAKPSPAPAAPIPAPSPSPVPPGGAAARRQGV